MPAQLDANKLAIDIGIVIRNSEATMKFYRDILGLEHVMDMPMPGGLAGGGIMHRFACGATTLKFVRLDSVPEASNPAGGLAGGTGLRYFTVWVENLDELVEEFRRAGVTVLVEASIIRPGVRIAFVEDPDGVWVELLESRPS